MVLDVSTVTVSELREIVRIEKCIEGNNAATLSILEDRFAMFSDGFLVAKLDDKLVGYVESCMWNRTIPSFQSEPDFFSRHHNVASEILYIIFLGVLPDFWRQGIASRLIQALQELAHRKGAQKVHAVTWDHLTELYTKQGFVAVRKMPGFLPTGEFTLLQYNCV